MSLCHIYLSFKYLQSWWLHRFPGQLIPVLDKPFRVWQFLQNGGFGSLVCQAIFKFIFIDSSPSGFNTAQRLQRILALSALLVWFVFILHKDKRRLGVFSLCVWQMLTMGICIRKACDSYFDFQSIVKISLTRKHLGKINIYPIFPLTSWKMQKFRMY